MFILASSSPNRRELFNNITTDYKIFPPDTEENYPPELPALEVPVFIARDKARAVAEKFPNDVIIAADSVVIAPNGEILGKPETDDEAYRMLKLFSGNVGICATGTCLNPNGQEITFSDTADMHFYELSDDEIRDYIKTGEPANAAGGFAVQKRGVLLVESISGNYSAAVGLPVARLYRELKKLKLI